MIALNMERMGRINRYFRAANFLTVAQMYLNDNFLLERPLAKEHIKERPTGHWGAAPGINMIIACILETISHTCSRDIDYGLVLGTGHANASLIANMYLNGFLRGYYPAYQYGYDGIARLCLSYGTEGGFSGEVNSAIPGCIYDGGELGYALSIAYGAVLHNRNKIVFTILGDGECETSVTTASWYCSRLINYPDSGTVLPIVNLNKYKMGSKSILSQMSRRELQGFFYALGYEVFIVESAEDLADSIQKSLEIIDGNHFSKGKRDTKWPAIIYCSLKGGSEPQGLGGDELSYAIASHKVPLKDPRNNEQDFLKLQRWLFSYKVNELFDEKGFPEKSILDLANANLFSMDREITELTLPDYSYNDGIKITISELLADYISEVIANSKNQIHIFSPDELLSNGFGSLLPTNSLSNSVSVTEILNEHICQGLCEGYLLTGRHGVIISYESFMPVVTSMVSQYMKFLYTAQNYSWRKKVPAMVILLTSVCWTNTYSHQNPEFVSDLLLKGYDFIKAYYPIDLGTALATMRYTLQSSDSVCAITFDKRNSQSTMDRLTAEKAVGQGFYIWDPNSSTESLDIVLLSTGDMANQQCQKILSYFYDMNISINICYVSILELSILDSSNCKKSPSHKQLNQIIDSGKPILYNFHGYASTITSLLFSRSQAASIRVMGYSNRSWMSASSLYKMAVNGVSWWDIGIQMCEMLIELKHHNIAELASLRDNLCYEKQDYIDAYKQNHD